MRVSCVVVATLFWALSPSVAGAEPAAASDSGQQAVRPGALVIPMPGTKLPDSKTLESLKAVPPPATAAAKSLLPEDLDAPTAPAAPVAAGEPVDPTPSDPVAEPTAVETAPVGETAPAAETAAAEPPPPPEPTLVIDINLSTQRMTVSENGTAKHTWLISSAALGYRTPTGTFKPSWMSRMWYSRQYDYSPMPHSIFFSGGVAIHATQAIRQLGRPASHGCIRLAPSNAANLYKMVGRHGKDMTKIVVHGSPRHSPTISSRNNHWRYGQGGRRRPAYAYYGAPPSYYVPAPKRRAGAPVKPRRYVSRGIMQSPYGY